MSAGTGCRAGGCKTGYGGLVGRSRNGVRLSREPPSAEMQVIRNEHAINHVSLFGVLAITKTRSDVDVHCERSRGRPG